MSKGDRIHVMSFGLGGNSGDGVSKDGNTYTSSWYLSGPDEFLRLIPEHYDPSEVDGCIIIDKRDVLEQKPGLAIRAPMCKANLSDDQIDRLSDIKGVEESLVLQAFARGSAEQRGLAALAAISIANTSKEPGPLDFVSPTAYAAWWKERGARVGVLVCEPEPRIEWAA